MDFLTEWGTRPLVSLPAITGMLAVNVTPLLNNVEVAARAGTQLCALGVGLCMLVLHIRKVRRGAGKREDE